MYIEDIAKKKAAAAKRVIEYIVIHKFKEENGKWTLVIPDPVSPRSHKFKEWRAKADKEKQHLEFFAPYLAYITAPNEEEQQQVLEFNYTNVHMKFAKVAWRGKGLLLNELGYPAHWTAEQRVNHWELYESGFIQTALAIKNHFKKLIVR